VLARQAWLQAVLVALVGWWGVTAYATYWIRSGAAATETAMGLSGRAEPNKALKHFQNAVAADPSYEFGMLSLASATIYDAHDVDRGLELLNEALRMHPDSAWGWEMLATILQALGRPAPAIEAAKEAVRTGPDSARAHGRYGILLSETGHADEAIDQYRQAIACWPGEAQMHLQLGKALAKRRQYAEAIAHFRMAHQWMKNDIEAASALARVLATVPEAEGGSAPEALRFAKEAVAMLRQAHQVEPIDRIMVMDTLAIANANTSHFPEAIQAARQALAFAGMMMSPHPADRRLAQLPPADRRQAQDLVTELRGRLKLFESNQAYRELPSR